MSIFHTNFAKTMKMVLNKRFGQGRLNVKGEMLCLRILGYRFPTKKKQAVRSAFLRRNVK